MAKWADYCISKITFNEEGSLIDRVFVCPDYDTTIGAAQSQEQNRSWLVREQNKGNTFCTYEPTTDGKFRKLTSVRYENSLFSWNVVLPKQITRHKTFISYYHLDNEGDRESFENRFGDLIINKSVEDGDIDSDNKDEYIKQLIQKKYLNDTTVLIVLVGENTKSRKHVDWEISGALDLKVGDHYAGLIGILLPDHPDHGKGSYSYSNLPKRLAANAESGYAKIYNWTEDRVEMQNWIEDAYAGRKTRADKRVNRAVKQKQRNSGS